MRYDEDTSRLGEFQFILAAHVGVGVLCSRLFRLVLGSIHSFGDLVEITQVEDLVCKCFEILLNSTLLGVEGKFFIIKFVRCFFWNLFI